MPVPVAFIDAVSPGELFVIFILVLLFFGPKRLPDMARTMGRTFDQLRRAADDFRDQLMNEAQPPAPLPGPPRALPAPPPAPGSEPLPPPSPPAVAPPSETETAAGNEHDLSG